MNYNAEGSYACAVLARGYENAGDKSFYDGLNENNSEHSTTDVSGGHSTKKDNTRTWVLTMMREPQI